MLEVGVRVNVRVRLELANNPNRNEQQPTKFGFSMTPPVYAPEIGVRVCGVGDFFFGHP